MVELKDATLTVDGQTLFTNLSVMAMNGKLTIITGLHGTGKTTLLRAMMGFIGLDQGLVSIDGELLTPLSATTFRRSMVYLPQAVEPSPSTFIPDTDDMEVAWAMDGVKSGEWNVETGARKEEDGLWQVGSEAGDYDGKRIVIADDPGPELLGRLKQAAADGLTVVVASRRDEYLRAANTVYELRVKSEEI
jgi:hypothetical protein